METFTSLREASPCPSARVTSHILWPHQIDPSSFTPSCALLIQQCLQPSWPEIFALRSICYFCIFLKLILVSGSLCAICRLPFLHYSFWRKVSQSVVFQRELSMHRETLFDDHAMMRWFIIWFALFLLLTSTYIRRYFSDSLLSRTFTIHF